MGAFGHGAQGQEFLAVRGELVQAEQLRELTAQVSMEAEAEKEVMGATKVPTMVKMARKVEEFRQVKPIPLEEVEVETEVIQVVLVLLALLVQTEVMEMMAQLHPTEQLYLDFISQGLKEIPESMGLQEKEAAVEVVAVAKDVHSAMTEPETVAVAVAEEAPQALVAVEVMAEGQPTEFSHGRMGLAVK